MPNCIGAIDGKHCAIKCPPGSGSVFYNYKGYHSLLLMAVADADYKFIYFDVGAYGSEGDSGVFRSCEFGKTLYSGNLKLPSATIIQDHKIPPYFVADDVFPLHKHIQKPFKPATRVQQLSYDERIFNYRLSRARRTVENAFGILSSRWLCLARTMFVGPNRAQKIIAACCLLHNYMMTNGKDEYAPAGFSDVVTDEGQILDGIWRNNVPANSMYYNSCDVSGGGRYPQNAKDVRNKLKYYFNSEGRVKWQDSSILFT